MYIDTCRTGKYVRHLLRENYRVKGKTKLRTIANLSSCTTDEIEALKLALRHKHDLSALITASEDITLRQGKSVGAVWAVYDMARKLGIADALGYTRQGKLALWQVIARVIDHGSLLSAVRLSGSHAAYDIMRLDDFDEDDLFENLTWLSQNQADVENRLYRENPDPGLFLYDVTSSYMGNDRNVYPAFGYNHANTKDKKQIVIGLLCDAGGRPISIEVFHSDTQESATFASQIRKIARRYGGGDITLVGNYGMIKNHQHAGPVQASKENVHARYEDLALVDKAFRTSRIVEREMRLIYDANGPSMRGHAFVVMLSYLIMRELSEAWREIDRTVEEGIFELSTLCSMDVLMQGKPQYAKVPEPRNLIATLLNAAQITLPSVIPSKGITAGTSKKAS